MMRSIDSNVRSTRANWLVHRQMIASHCYVIRARRSITLHPNSCLRITVTRFSPRLHGYVYRITTSPMTEWLISCDDGQEEKDMRRNLDLEIENEISISISWSRNAPIEEYFSLWIGRIPFSSSSSFLFNDRLAERIREVNFFSQPGHWPSRCGAASLVKPKLCKMRLLSRVTSKL